MILITENTFAIANFCRGTSSKKDLFELVVKLRLLEMRAGAKILLIHVARPKMMEQGIHGLYQGNLLFLGVKNKDIPRFITLHRSW